MNAVPSIVLVDLASNEKHFLNTADCILGRNWLQCDDKRISRNHGILKILSKTLVSVQSTHQNSIFYRKKDDTQIHHIQQNQEVNLHIGDTFGLLVDKFWFCIQKIDENSEPNEMNGSTNKRRTSSSEPDSTNKKVKTEPDEFQSSNGDDETANNGDTTLVMPNDDAVNGDGDGATANIVDENTTNSQLPSTSSGATSSSQNGTCLCNRQIKSEPIDLDENEAQPIQTGGAVVIKVEPDIEQNCIHCAGNATVKTEIKEEPAGDGVASSSNDALASGGNPAEAASNSQSVTSNTDQTANEQAQRPALRECCRYGVRCYRRNPAHKAEQAHPGDVDYRLPDYPDPPLGTPQCPFLDRCYRRNPIHFQQFSHKTNLRPGDDKNKAGYEATATEPNQPENRPNFANADTDDEDDPYHTDGDSDADYDGYSSPDSDDMPGFRNM